jgi:hypothetical protein
VFDMIALVLLLFKFCIAVLITLLASECPLTSPSICCMVLYGLFAVLVGLRWVMMLFRLLLIM